MIEVSFYLLIYLYYQDVAEGSFKFMFHRPVSREKGSFLQVLIIVKIKSPRERL